jgi:beta-lactamase superfamily II metal-dependent hydrolase
MVNYISNPWKSGWKITQYNTTTGNQAMFYSIEDKAGNLALIDGGYNCDGDISQVLNVIKRHDNHVTTWILTHPHHDHIGVFNGLYPYAGKIGIRIDKIYATDAKRNRIIAMARENTQDIETYDDFIKAVGNGSRVKYVHTGDKINILSGLSARVLHAWDKNVDNTDCNPCNNGSIMFNVCGKKQKMLFCADTEEPIEKYIKDRNADDLKADYVQCGHHGSTGLSTGFYDLVGATKGAFFDGPDSLYDKKTADGTGYILYNYFKNKNVPVYKLSGAPNEIVLK